MIHADAEFEVARPAGEVFAIVDDLSKTPKWLERCQECKQTSPGPRAVGARLHYTYKEGGRTGTMDGEVKEYEPGKRVLYAYADKMFDVKVGFRFEPKASGTKVVHEVDIQPKSFFAKLLSPIIRGALKKNTARDIGKLKELVEKGG